MGEWGKSRGIGLEKGESGMGEVLGSGGEEVLGIGREVDGEGVVGGYVFGSERGWGGVYEVYGVVEGGRYGE